MPTQLHRRQLAEPQILFLKLHPDAKLPKRAEIGSAGLDLYAAGPRENDDIWQGDEAVINPGQRSLIGTGVAVEIPKGFYGRIAPRSGMAWQSGIDVMGGVIDPGYRGEIGVILINHGHHLFRVKSGDRIAQMIIEYCAWPEPEWKESLTATDRGEAGFGSTGK